MDYELLFSCAGALAMIGWLCLLVSPWMPVWSDRIATFAVPGLLALLYISILVFQPTESGGFSSFAGITELFSNPQALLAGWIHFLAFDLFVGAWICRKARADGIKFWIVLPCLPITLLLGPVGYLLFSIILGGNSAFQKPSLKDR